MRMELFQALAMHDRLATHLETQEIVSDEITHASATSMTGMLFTLAITCAT